MSSVKTGDLRSGKVPPFLRALVNLKPPCLAIGGMSLTVINMMIGNLLVAHIPPGLLHTCLVMALIATTLAVPPFSLAVLLLHYRRSAASLRSIVSLYLSLVVICANINLDMMIHFGHHGTLPFHGMASMWDFSATGEMSLSWPNFFLVVIDCLHFSIETLSTVGYGDITPATWYAKTAVDIQVLMGLGITVLAVGTHFSARKAPGSAASYEHVLADAAVCPHCGSPHGLANRRGLEQGRARHAEIQSRG